MPELKNHQPSPEELKSEKKLLESRLAQIQQEMSEIEANPIVSKVGKDKAILARILRSGAVRTSNQDLIDRLDCRYDEMTIAEMLEFEDETLLASGALTIQEIRNRFAESSDNTLIFEELQQKYGELISERDQITDRLTEIESLYWPYKMPDNKKF